MEYNNFVRASLCFALIMTFTHESLGQSGKYKRAKKAEAVIAAPATTPPPTTAGDKKEEKVDIKEIEQQYWSEKDTEFKVVQNRRYTKEKRFFGSLGVGTLIGDENSTGFAYNASAGYFFDEQMGVELLYSQYNVKDTKAISEFKNTYTVTVNHNKPSRFMGAAFVWMPIYAKLSLLDKQIIYFDMSFSPVLGLSWGDQQLRYGESEDGPNFTFGLDVAQHFYVSEHFAVKVDYRNRFYSEKVKQWNNNPANPGVSSAAADNSRILTTLSLGLVYFY